MRAFASKLAAPLAVGVLAAACSQHGGDDLRVSLSPTLVMPRGLLDNVQTLTVAVYDAVGGVDCDTTTGQATGTSGATPVIAPTKLDTVGCVAPAKYCGTLTISSSSKQRVFAAVALDSNKTEIADGCTKVVVNQESLPLTIQMQRNVPPSVCGDGTVQPTEQCEPAGDAAALVCDDQCHTKEERLSVSSGVAGNTIDGAVGDKQQPSFTWPSGSGANGRFLSVWSDKKPRQQAAMRVLSDTLDLDSSLGPAPSSVSFWLPDSTSSSFPPNGEPNNQAFPTATFSNGKYFVAFQDDSTGHLEIHLRSMSANNPTVGDQPSGAPIGISGPNGGGEAGVIHTLPSIAAGPGGAVYVAWQAGSTTGPGKIVGRMFTPPSTYGAQVELSSGATNQNVQVAATSSGWVVVWQSGSDISLRRIDTSGNPSAAEQKVNDSSHSGTQDHPGVATAGDAFAVVWADHGAPAGTDIFVQRYASDGTAIAGDQANHINNVNTDGEQTAPAITGSSSAGGMFAVAWIDGSSSHVRARLLDAKGGFLFNNVDGQTSEFQASVTDGHARNNPALAIGGSGPFIAIGWEDLDASKPGIYVRRFPLPTQ
jgi:hypothetical protein